jgi:hypothetical protein
VLTPSADASLVKWGFAIGGAYRLWPFAQASKGVAGMVPNRHDHISVHKPT